MHPERNCISKISVPSVELHLGLPPRRPKVSLLVPSLLRIRVADRLETLSREKSGQSERARAVAAVAAVCALRSQRAEARPKPPESIFGLGLGCVISRHDGAVDPSLPRHSPAYCCRFFRLRAALWGSRTTASNPGASWVFAVLRLLHLLRRLHLLLGASELDSPAFDLASL